MCYQTRIQNAMDRLGVGEHIPQKGDLPEIYMSKLACAFEELNHKFQQERMDKHLASQMYAATQPETDNRTKGIEEQSLVGVGWQQILKWYQEKRTMPQPSGIMTWDIEEDMPGPRTECECGSEKAGIPGHSSYCPLYGR